MKKSCFDFYKNRWLSSWPLWMMRQAGRTLPEYRKIKEKHASFIEMMKKPEIVSMITMQPMQRWDCDAAVIFSDILLPLADVPGATVSFDKQFQPGVSLKFSDVLSFTESNRSFQPQVFSSILEGISLVKEKLTKGQELIGFCGGVWTLFAYCLSPKTPIDWSVVFSKITELSSAELIIWRDFLIDLTVDVLMQQEKAGATQSMIFDSWLRYLPKEHSSFWIDEGLLMIIAKLKKQGAQNPIIVYAPSFSAYCAESTRSGCFEILACDESDFLTALQSDHLTLQGNINPLWLLESKKQIAPKIHEWREKIHTPVIVNLSSGLHPETPLENIEEFIRCIRLETLV